MPNKGIPGQKSISFQKRSVQVQYMFTFINIAQSTQNCSLSAKQGPRLGGAAPGSIHRSVDVDRLKLMNDAGFTVRCRWEQIFKHLFRLIGIQVSHGSLIDKGPPAYETYQLERKAQHVFVD